MINNYQAFTRNTKYFPLRSAADSFSRSSENTSAQSQSAPCACYTRCAEPLRLQKGPCVSVAQQTLIERSWWGVAIRLDRKGGGQHVQWQSSAQRAIRYKFDLNRLRYCEVDKQVAAYFDNVQVDMGTVLKIHENKQKTQRRVKGESTADFWGSTLWCVLWIVVLSFNLKGCRVDREISHWLLSVLHFPPKKWNTHLKCFYWSPPFLTFSTLFILEHVICIIIFWYFWNAIYDTQIEVEYPQGSLTHWESICSFRSQCFTYWLPMNDESSVSRRTVQLCFSNLNMARQRWPQSPPDHVLG